MNCLNPLRIANPKTREILYDVRRKYRRSPEEVYEKIVRSKYPLVDPFVDVPCGKCEACLVRKTNEWTFRLLQERKHSESALFMTITYHDGALPIDKKTGYPTLSKRDCQLFLMKIRKRFGPGIRYFLCSEYGEKYGRPHYHMLLFNFPIDYSSPTWDSDLETLFMEMWNKGDIQVSEAVDGRVVYCAKYMLQTLDMDDYLERKKPFILCSRMPGIGMQFVENRSISDYYRSTCDTKCVSDVGIAYPMPRYYKDKLFDDDMKYVIKKRLEKTFKEPTEHEKIAYKNKIRRNFKKQHKL